MPDYGPGSEPAIAGWFKSDPKPALLGSRCKSCQLVFFPPVSGYCRNPACMSMEWESIELSRRGVIWSYTDAQYRPPPPFIAMTEPYEPFAIAAVELAEGITVLGQVASGYGVDDLQVGAEVELVVEPLLIDNSGTLTIWRWKPMEKSR